jgi:hypothetical protein
MLGDKPMTNVDPELLLDVAELAMRLQRDLGWSPAATNEEGPRAKGSSAEP